MNYRMLGKTGVRVSEIGFGAWAIGGGININGFGIGYGAIDDRESEAAIRRAVDLGVTFFDTADAYGAGHSEEVLGQALGGRWEGLALATKVGNQRRDPLPSVKNFARDYILQACDNSLRRLKKGVIDVYQLHNPSPEVLRDDSVFETLNDLKRAGKIRFAGVSISSPQEGIELIQAGKADALQVHYNILMASPEDALFPLAEREGIGIIVRVPLASGILTGKFTRETVFDPTDHRANWLKGEMLEKAVAKTEALSALVGGPVRSLSELALRYCLASPAVSTLIPGAKNPRQVEANRAASDGYRLPPDLLEQIRRIGEKDFGLRT
ncbi:MAG: aldo/keto reductase [Armatimonadetes bacterium]|nr:aldo/keto reductase [Armatimonadota bacterium]